MNTFEWIAAAFRIFAVVAAIKAAGGRGQVRTTLHAVADGQDLGEFPFITITV